ncbi:MAG TPA: RIP metalloprotease RseP [Crocinitomicaceae bacterium]|nr:RIP metalloprotease RseP [Crocinitomicaceae bacterium]
MDFLIKAAQLLLSLSILVVLHEFGHYLTARYFKIRVEKFYLFFNPWFSIFKKKIGETEWGIGWLPLGGYVKISGMVDESMDKEQMAQPIQPWEFRAKPAWQRLIVMIGGVVVNLIVGVLIYIFVVFAWGEEQIHTEDLQAGLSIHPYMQKYGLESGDNILAIEDEEVLHYADISSGLLVRNQHKLKVKHANGEIEKIILPEGIDYEVFKAGAFPVVGLRHKSTEINYFSAIANDETIGIKSGDAIVQINDTDLNSIEFNNLDKLEKVVLKIAREEDTLEVIIKNDELKNLAIVYPGFGAGLKEGDKIIKVNEEDVVYFDDFSDELFHSKNKKAAVTVLRKGEKITVSAPVTENGKLGFYTIGVAPIDKDAYQHIDYSFGASISRGFSRGMTTLSDYVGQLKFIFTKKGASSIGGFGAIGNLFPPTWDWQIFWLNTALISIILAFMNILPIPALDGGHVVFLLYEMVTGKEAPQKVLEYAQMVGFFILMALLLYANGNDIYRAFFGG